MSPPEWMVRDARTNPIVAAYLRMWTMGEADRAVFFETLATELSAQNAELTKLATKILEE